MLCSRTVATVRSEVLRLQDLFIEEKRLDEKGDIFHLNMVDLDLALADPSYDLRAVLTPNKARYDEVGRIVKQLFL